MVGGRLIACFQPARWFGGDGDSQQAGLHDVGVDADAEHHPPAAVARLDIGSGAAVLDSVLPIVDDGEFEARLRRQRLDIGVDEALPTP